MKRYLLLLFISIISIYTYSDNISILKNDILSITKNKKATVGVAILSESDTLTINNEYRYPTMSVYKFHQALAVLDYLSKNNLSLDMKLKIYKKNLNLTTYSPMIDDIQGDSFEISIEDLLKYSVSKSDNNACDILFKYVGGTKYVDDYLKQIGIKDTYISATESEMAIVAENQYLNWTTPLSAALALNDFLNKDLLNPQYKIFLENTLKETSTGEDKIKSLLPQNTIVGHKTGSSSRNEYGMKIADNDLGFVILPNNKRYIIAIFVMNSMEDDKTNASIIAEISKKVYDYFVKQD